MPLKASTDAFSAAGRSQLNLLLTQFTARCSRELLHSRDADGIASTLAGGTLVEEVVEGGCLGNMVALTHVLTFKE